MGVILIILFLPIFWAVTRWIGTAEEEGGSFAGRFIVGVLALLALFSFLASLSF